MPKGYRDLRIMVPRRSVFRAGAILLFLAIGIVVAFERGGAAQSLSPNALQGLAGQILQNGNTSGLPGVATGQPVQNLPPPITLQPAPPSPQIVLPPSRLEQIISARVGAKLRQFGYDQLGSGRPVTIPQTGAVQDDYVMGPGDEVNVSLRGQENNDFRAVVDRNGQVSLPRLPPIPASGRTFGDFRQDVVAAVHRAYVASSASVSIGQVRQISVLVSGEVNSPGQRLLTGLSSPVDALLLSGGVKKTGSLRNIRVQRGGRSYSIDLYSVLTTAGSASTFRLADGDRILVPLLGKTVAITGLVRQPAIYELAPLQSSLSVRSLMALAGGEEVQGKYRLSLMNIDPEGRASLSAVADENAIVKAGDILFVQLGADQTISQATLSGGVGLAGSYPVVSGTKLSEMLRVPGALGAAPYTLFGIISRKDPRSLLRTLAAFTPAAVLNGGEDQALQSDDIVRPISSREERLVISTMQVFLQQRARDEQLLRNPVSALSNAQPAAIVPTTTSPTGATSSTILPNSTSALTEKSGRSVGELAQDQESEIQLIGSFTQRQLDMVVSGQVSVTDFRYTADQTEAPVTGGVYLPLSADRELAASATLSAQIMQQNPNAPQPTSEGQGLPLPPQSGPVNAESSQLVPQNSYEGNNRPPAPNFQEEPSSNVFPRNREAPTLNALAQQLGVDPLVLINFVIDHQVTVDGAVRGPGSYFVGPQTSLQDLVQAAGGTINWADKSGVQVISTAIDSNSGQSITQRVNLPLQQGLLASYIVKPHDGFHFNQVYNDGNIGNVTIQGEVRFTGNYRITRGEHLSDLLAQAGGLTNTAYPYGTVFLRKSAADAEHQGYMRAADEIQDELVVAMTRIGNDKIDASTFASLQTFVEQLRTQPAVGRISVTADPSVLAAKPDLDPLLEPGDVVYLPQRPSTIAVLGQVSQPGHFPYQTGMTMQDYIEQAGGYSSTADDSLTFIVLPDGSARKAENSWLSYDTQKLPPGSTIVVPREMSPLDTRQIIMDVSSLFSQLAVSAASLAVLATVH